MSEEFDNWTLAFSQKIYERLLLAYPKSHRAEYGAAMSQLFHDQCRDAWIESQNRGVMKLWLRVLPDLVKTSFIERLAALNKRKSMTDKMTTLIQPCKIFLKVFVAVFLIILCTTVAVTFILPETYASISRIKAESDNPLDDPQFLQTTFEIIQSQTVLDPVIDKLHLNAMWGKKYKGGEPLEATNTLKLLKARISLTPERNTKIIDITVYSEDKNEAAQIANAIVQSYQDYRTASRIKFQPEKLDARIPVNPTVEIVDTAKPGHDPVRPNKPLNIVWGIAIGTLVGLAIGAGMSGIAALVGRKSGGGGSTPDTGAAPPPVTPHSADCSHAKVSLDKIVGLLWMGISGLLSGLGLFVLFETFGNVPKFPESLFIPIFGIFWGGNIVAGFFLFRGKFWARIFVGVEAILLTNYFLFIGVPLVPHLFRWLPIVFMTITACGLFWPRKQIAANSR
jgi:capsular polysaccharide biosynthesis protein